jgi:hypothetical protein
MHLWAFQDLRATLRCELALADLVGVLGALARAVFALPFLVDTVQALASDLVSEHPIGARHHFSVRVPSCCDYPFSITASFGYCADAFTPRCPDPRAQAEKQVRPLFPMAAVDLH